jgi:hypothetical protein
MFKTICALLKRKPVEPNFPVKPEIKKELVKKATTRKPKKETASHPIEVKFVPAKKKAIKKANKRLIKSEK